MTNDTILCRHAILHLISVINISRAVLTFEAEVKVDLSVCTVDGYDGIVRECEVVLSSAVQHTQEPPGGIYKRLRCRGDGV